MEHISNDNSEGLVPAEQLSNDGHGRAALLLVESLAHGLVARNLLNAAEMIEILDVAIDIGAETDVDSGHQASTRDAVVLLSAISSTFKIDLPDT